MFLSVSAVIALSAGLFQINPIWNRPVPAGRRVRGQPARLVRHVPRRPRAPHAGLADHHPDRDGYSIPPIFWRAAVGFGAMLTLTAAYPFLERRWTRDHQRHNLLQRPRDVPHRTGLGVMALTFFLIATVSGGNDIIADKFHVSLNAMTWAGRIGLLLGPPLAYAITVSPREGRG